MNEHILTHILYGQIRSSDSFSSNSTPQNTKQNQMIVKYFYANVTNLGNYDAHICMKVYKMVYSVYGGGQILHMYVQPTPCKKFMLASLGCIACLCTREADTSIQEYKVGQLPEELWVLSGQGSTLEHSTGSGAKHSSHLARWPGQADLGL